MRTTSRTALAVMALLAAAGCAKSRPVAGPSAPVTVPAGGPGGGTVTVVPTSCTACHGDPARLAGAATNPLIASAPPRGLLNEQSGRPVGAHDAHLRDGSFARALACAQCHLVPGSASTHPAQAQQKVTFSLLARAAWTGQPDPDPQWNGTSCSATYCHGSFPGGNAATVDWMGPGVSCGDCHDLPPAATHPLASVPAGASCGACHQGYSGVRGGALDTFAVNLDTHLNGRLDGGGHPAGWVDPVAAARGGPHAIAANEHGVSPSATDAAACGNCHGADLSGGPGGLPRGCTTCHDGASHDVGGATVTVVAFLNGATPNCTACHGGTLTGNDGGAVARDPAPPLATQRTTARPDSGSHARHLPAAGATGGIAAPASLSCAQCHATPGAWYHSDGAVGIVWGNTATGNGSRSPSFDAAAHSCSATWCHGNFQNGNARTVTWGEAGSAACGSCHGSATNPVPASGHPALTAGLACSGCHDGYGGAAGDPIASFTVNQALHVNGTIDAAGHVTPYPPSLHGPAALAPASSTAGLAACAGCHVGFGSSNGLTATDCNACHAALTGAGPTWLQNCTFCHGGRDNTTGAPPRDTHVLASDLATPQPTTLATIGAHTSHVEGAHAIASPLACTACHPTLWTSADPAVAPGHVDAATATVQFGDVGPTANPGSYARPTCSASYCHGNFAGGAAATPAWTGTFGATFTLSCQSCHLSPPPVGGSGHHPQNAACATCHGAGYALAGVSGAALPTHVDGQAQRPANGCTACHGELAGPTGAAVGNSDPRAAPGYGGQPTSFDTRGGNTVASRGVGAHDVHLTGGRSRAVACDQCHQVPLAGDTQHANGTAAVTFNAALANKTGTAQAYSAAGLSCTATYCHGSLGGGVGTSSVTPAWNGTGGALACSACHGLPPTVTSTGHYHPQNTDCGACHTGYTIGAVVKASHVDGTVQYTLAADACVTCHGTAGRAASTGTGGPFDAHLAAAPPVDTTGASTGARVGAHLAHVNPSAAGQAYKPIACTECHPDNATPLHAQAAGGGAAVVTFAAATAANLAGATPSYSPATHACSSTYCHGGTLPAQYQGSVTTWAWDSATAADCGSCHGFPPSTAGHTAAVPPVTSASNCGACHPGYGVGAVNLATHINGQLDGGESSGNTNCTNCHHFEMLVSDANRTLTYHHVLGAGAFLSGGVTAYPTNATPVNSGDKACIQCHADHNVWRPDLNSGSPGRAYNLRASITAAPPASAGTITAAPAAGNFANTDSGATAPYGICVSCHTSSQTKDQTNQKSDGTVATLAIDGAAFTAANVAHTYTATGTITRDGSTFTVACVRCHMGGISQYQTAGTGGTFMLHTSVDRRLLNPLGQTAPADNMEEKFCFRCHHKVGDVSPGGGPAKTVANSDYFGAVTNMSADAQAIFGLMQLTHGHKPGSYAGVHKPNPGEETYDGVAGNDPAKHVECTDCHNPHEAQKSTHTPPTNLASGAIRGASGARPTAWPATNWTAPAGYTFIPKIGASNFEYELCFKCHSGANTGLATWDATWTNLALEFNPANASYHPVAGGLPATDPGANGSSRLAASQLVGTDRTWTAGSTMTCSDCHGGDASSPATQGPHGSAVRFMLAGTNKAWPYTQAAQNGGSTGTLFRLGTSETGLGTSNGLFCRNCHPNPTAAGSNNLHRHSDLTGGEHGGSGITACTSCHIRVPHGGKVSRLIVTTNAPARYRVGTPNFSSFTKAASYTGYDQNNIETNIGSSCGQHASTRAEAW